MTTRVIDLFLDPGNHAARPAAASVPVGSLYPCSDHGVERNDDGTTWSLWDGIAAGFSGDGADLTGGPVPTAVLGSGTADATKFLRGDNTWAVPAGGGGTATIDDAFPPLLYAGATSAGTRYTCGSAIVVDINATITRMAVRHKPVSGRTYRFAVWNYDTTTNTLGTEVAGVDTVAPFTNTNLVQLTSGPISATVVAGSTYLFTITDLTGGNVGLGHKNGSDATDGWLGHTLGADGFMTTNTNPPISGTVMTDVGSYAVAWRIIAEPSW
ncbi:hypothetical protein [Aeromicrobium sp.]|uniref:hypothetical protein n=1 Tax=Aeromicrobium sp. TaxID=1871063 RepID=UPI002FC89690